MGSGTFRRKRVCHFRTFSSSDANFETVSSGWQENELTRAEAAYDNSERSNEKRKTLEELFRPPLDLMFRGSMDAVS